MRTSRIETVTPIDLHETVVHLHQGGAVHAGKGATASDHDGWRLRVFHAKTDADVHAGTWEVHPEGEKIVSCLIGTIRLYLRPERPGRPEEEIRLRAGAAAVVPRGRRHRIGLDTPSSILAVTPPCGAPRARGTGSVPRSTKAGER